MNIAGGMHTSDFASLAAKLLVASIPVAIFVVRSAHDRNCAVRELNPG